MAIANGYLAGIAFPLITFFGMILWLSVFSTTYKNSGHLEREHRKLAGIFNATLISMVVTDMIYIALLIVLRNI